MGSKPSQSALGSSHLNLDNSPGLAALQKKASTPPTVSSWSSPSGNSIGPAAAAPRISLRAREKALVNGAASSGAPASVPRSPLSGASLGGTTAYPVPPGAAFDAAEPGRSRAFSNREVSAEEKAWEEYTSSNLLY